MSSSLQIHLLGHIRVMVDGAPVRIKAPPRVTPLWAYLLLHREVPVSRQSLAYLIWPDEAEDSARGNLRRHLHQLKRALPPPPPERPWLLVDAEHVQWNPDSDYWLDVAEFERLSANPETCEDALALYTGDLLASLYDDWLFHPRERLRNLYASSLHHLIQRYWTQRDYSRALSYAGQLLALDSLREDTVRQVMALRYESGDRAGALSQYEGFLRLLRQELAVEPMPETTALYETILRDQGLPGPATPVSPGVVTGPKDAQLRLPFVGREMELDELKAWWNRATQGQGRLVMVAGEAGVGKTRLVEEFAHLVDSQGGRVLKGVALPRGEVPYQAMVSALRGALPMLAALEIDPLWLAVVAMLVPELSERRARGGVSLPTPAELSPASNRDRLFEAIAQCLESLSGPRPLMLILEDLQWAGEGTISLLEFIARRLFRQPVLILATYRQEETWRSQWISDLRRRLQRENLLTHLALESLSSAAVFELVGQLGGPGPDTQALGEELYAASGGNPFFLLELVQDLITAGTIRVADGQWSLAAPIVGTVPQKVSQMIVTRLERLSDHARTLAEIAAVIGPAFDVELVHQVSGWSESRVLDSLDELLDQQIVREALSGSRFDYTFTHDLIQATIYESCPQSGRKRRHRRIAHVLEGFVSAPHQEMPAELALHFDRGGEPEQAAQHYLSAAQRAFSVYASHEALAALERALELSVDSQLRLEVHALREEIWHRQGERQAQEAELARLAELADNTGDDEWICEVLRRQIRYRRALGDRQAEGELVQALKGRAASSGAIRWQAEALRAEATYQILLSQYGNAQARLEEALPLFQSIDDAGGQIACYCAFIDIATQRSQFDEAQKLLQNAHLLAEASADQSLLVGTLRTASGTAFARQEFETSLGLGQQMLDLCRTIGDREGEADALSRMGTSLARLFRVQQARQSYQQAAALYDKLGKRQGQAAVRLNAGVLAINLGRYSEGITWFLQAGELFATLQDRRGQMLSALNLSAAYIYIGDFHNAAQAAQKSLELARQIQILFVEAIALGNLGECWLNLGDVSQAIQYLLAALALRRDRNLPPGDSAADLAVLIVAYLKAGDKDNALQTAEEVLALNDSKAESIPYPQQALWAASQAYAASGQTEKARDLLIRAHAILEEKTAAIPDPESKAAFLQLPYNKEVLQAYTRSQKDK